MEALSKNGQKAQTTQPTSNQLRIPTAKSQFHFGFEFTRSPEDLDRLSDELESLAQERNALIHLNLAQVNFDNEAECIALWNQLNAQNDRMIRAIEILGSILTGLDKLTGWIASEEGQRERSRFRIGVRASGLKPNQPLAADALVSGADNFRKAAQQQAFMDPVEKDDGVVTTSQYDGLNRLTRLTHAKSGNTLADFQYQFNAVSSIAQMIDGAGTHNYTYDTRDRLTGATHPNQTNESYTLDDVGNRTVSHYGSSYSYQAFNRLVTANSSNFGYNANGNLTSKTDASGSWTYTWDYENRLTHASKAGGVTVTYSYDALGRRTQRTSSSGGMTKFVYDGADVVRDLNADLTIAADYLNGPGIDNKLRQTPDGTASYFVTDHLGTTRALTDASGNLHSSLTYDSFGNVASGSISSRYTYTSRETDSDVGLLYYRARWYDPQQGRFISEDPIGLDGGMDLYTYVENNPTNSADPWGLFTIRDGIRQRRAVDIDAQCGSRPGGACTTGVVALIVCTCKCDGADWKASAELRIYGQMWIYSGPFPYKGRRPVDRSVVDRKSAIAHEYNAHINPAIAAVTPLIDTLEARTFKSEKECQRGCEEISKQVGDLFRETLLRTQEQENRR